MPARQACSSHISSSSAYNRLIPRKIDIPAATAEAAIVLIVIGLVFVSALTGWLVGHSRSHTRTVTVGGACKS